jgi:hypothetical protein
VAEITDDDRQVLTRWLTGSHAAQNASDVIRLQDIANRVADDAKNDEHITQFYSDRVNKTKDRVGLSDSAVQNAIINILKLS